MRSRLAQPGDPVPCIKCDRREPGLSWGDYCSVCREELDKKASSIARRAAILGALIMGASLFFQGLTDFKSRLFGAASVLLVYLIVQRVVSRAVLEYQRREDSKTVSRRL